MIDTTKERAITSDDYTKKFKALLVELSSSYKEFPSYIIEIGAEKYNIPQSEIKLLIRSFLKQGILLLIDSNLFKIEKGLKIINLKLN